MYYKYPSTPHLPWSPGASRADRWIQDLSVLESSEVVVTEKMDGENTSIYSDWVHARSIDSRHHPSRSWVKGLQAQIGHQIPDGFRLCGENLFARHSIPYEGLEGYFYLFAVYDDANRCLDWDATAAGAERLAIPLVRTMYRGPYDEKVLRKLDFDTDKVEGYVVRTVKGFAHGDFSDHVRKWVRAQHVNTDQHWMHQAVVPNTLKEES